MEWLLGNPWDWVVIVVLLTLAVAIGVKEGEQPVVPTPVVVRSLGVFTVILIIFNFSAVVKLFTG